MPEPLVQIEQKAPHGDWRDPHVEFRKGSICYSAAAKNLTYLDLPNPREWQPFDSDWKLPPDWKRILLDGMKERLGKYRSFRLFMDICVRCGACADKCHFYLGSADPKNMPVARAERPPQPRRAEECTVACVCAGVVDRGARGAGPGRLLGAGCPAVRGARRRGGGVLGGVVDGADGAALSAGAGRPPLRLAHALRH